MSVNGFVHQLERRDRVLRRSSHSTSARDKVSRPTPSPPRSTRVRLHPGCLHRRLPAAARDGLGHVGGFKLEVEDRSERVRSSLRRGARRAEARRNQNPALAGLFTSYQVNVPQLDVNVDRVKAQTPGRHAARTSSKPCRSTSARSTSTTSTASGAPIRSWPRRTRRSAPAPRTSRALQDPQRRRRRWSRWGRSSHVTATSALIASMRYNGYPAAEINGGPAPGYSSGQAQAVMTQILKDTLPQRHDLRVDRPDLSAAHLGQHRPGHLSAVRAVRVPGAGRAVREPERCRWRSS